MSRPLLLVDVDGVISLFGFDPAAPPPGRWTMVEGIAHLLSATAGEHLRELAEIYELVWCTGWEEKASHYLPGLLALGSDVPHVSFERNPGRSNTHWKLAAIEAHAGPIRPLAWIDDAHEPRTRSWALHRSGPTLLVETEPAIGLTAVQVSQLIDWAATAPGRP